MVGLVGADGGVDGVAQLGKGGGGELLGGQEVVDVGFELLDANGGEGTVSGLFGGADVVGVAAPVAA